MRTPRIFVLCLFAAAYSYALPAVLSLKLPTGAKPAAIEIGAQGDVFVAGSIWTPYPNAVIADSFVARYNPASDSLIYFTKFGAPAHFTQNGLALDAAGNVYLIGDASTSFPATGSSTASATPIAVALKVGPTGQIVYSTLIAGSSKGGAIAANAAGDAYITGSTDGTTILNSTAGAAVSRSNLGFVAKLDAAGAHLLWVDRGVGGVAIALDAQENVYASGAYSLMDPADPTAPPVTPGTLALQTKFVSCSVSFLSSFPCSHQHIAKLDSTGTKLIYGLYLTGQYGARPSSMAVDAQGDLYLTGYTAASDFPVTAGAVDPIFLPVINTVVPSASKGLAPRLTVFEAPPEIGFVSELNPDASALVFSTYLGSTPPAPINTKIVTGVLTRDSVTKLRLYKNQIYVAGITNGTGFTGLSDVPKSCIPATFLLRVANDGRSVDQAHSAAIPNAANTLADLRAYALTSSVAFDAQGQAYQVGPFDGAYRFDPAVTDLPSSCVTDSATYQVTRVVAPGQLLSVFGSTLGSTAAAATPSAGLLPTALGASAVDFDGIPARLLYASAQQVNAMVPYEIAGRTQTTMTVRTLNPGGGAVASTALLNVTTRNPSAFGLDIPSSTCGEVDDTLVRLPDGTFNTCTNAAPSGSIVSIFINGAGVPGFTPNSGQIAAQAIKVNVPVATTGTLGASSTAVTVDVVNFSLEPGSVSGVWRLDLRAPTVQTGTASIHFTVTIDGVPLENRILTMYVKQ